MKLSGKKRTVDGSMSTKVKKSFSLSRKSLEYLRSTAKRNHARSESEALDQILEAARKREQREQYKAEMIAYYDSLTDEQMAEDAAWGELGAEGLQATEWLPKG